MRLALFIAALLLGGVLPATGRDDGRYATADPALHIWFDGLASGKGPCCSFADGIKIDDPEWGVSRACAGADGELRCKNIYWVRLKGQIIYIPDNAVITEKSRVKFAVVWPYLTADGATQIRCFLPGPGA